MSIRRGRSTSVLDTHLGGAGVVGGPNSRLSYWHNDPTVLSAHSQAEMLQVLAFLHQLLGAGSVVDWKRVNIAGGRMRW